MEAMGTIWDVVDNCNEKEDANVRTTNVKVMISETHTKCAPTLSCVLILKGTS